MGSVIRRIPVRSDGRPSVVHMPLLACLSWSQAFNLSTAHAFLAGRRAAFTIASARFHSRRFDTHFFSSSSTSPPFASICSTITLLSSIFSRMKSTVFFSTNPSERPWPSNPGTSSVRRSKPSLIA